MKTVIIILTILLLISCNNIDGGLIYIKAGGLNSVNQYSFYNSKDRKLYYLNLEKIGYIKKGSGHCRINIDSKNKLVYMLEKDNNLNVLKIISLIDYKILHKILLEGSIKIIKPQNNYFLYSSAYEIFKYDLENNTTESLYKSEKVISNYCYFESMNYLIIENYVGEGNSKILIKNIIDNTFKSIEDLSNPNYSTDFNIIIYSNSYTNKVEILKLNDNHKIITNFNATTIKSYSIKNENEFFAIQESFKDLNSLELVYNSYDYHSLYHYNIETEQRTRLFTKKMIFPEISYMNEDFSYLDCIEKD